MKKDTSAVEFDKSLDDFIDEIEKRKLLFGESGKDDFWGGVIGSQKKFASSSEKDRVGIKQWLENRSEVQDSKVGVFLDAWNDPKWNE